MRPVGVVRWTASSVERHDVWCCERTWYPVGRLILMVDVGGGGGSPVEDGNNGDSTVATISHRTGLTC